jgi:hypothetical protein
MPTPNREIVRFVEHVGGNTKAAKILGCSSDLIRKLKTGERGLKGIDPKYVRAMYYHKGFRLSFLRLYDLEWRKK